jgi:hypothetical protein
MQNAVGPVPSEILDQFVREVPISPEELDAAVRRFKKAIIERTLGGEADKSPGLRAWWRETRRHQ